MRGLSTCCHLDLALGLISALPRADPLTEEEVLLLFSNTREQQPTPPTHTHPFHSSALSAKQPNWRWWRAGGGRRGQEDGCKPRPPLPTRLPPRSPPPIRPSRLQNGGPSSPSCRVPQKCECLRISPIPRDKSEGPRRAREEVPRGRWWCRNPLPARPTPRTRS